MTFKERLLELNKRGLIHAPDESDDTFFLRCRKAKASTSSPSSSIAKDIYDIDPDWVGMVYDNKGLRFWEGGCTWLQRDHITLQLNKAFEKKTRYFGYTREEIIAHELVHVVRGYFEEPVFEEILAYRSSPSFFRRFFAPLFRTTGESLCFVFMLAACCTTTVLGTYQKIALSAFLLFIVGGFARLLWAQWTFAKTVHKLNQIVGKEKTLAVMIRLTDREIIRFSRMSLEAIQAYARKMAKIHMRWQQIVGAYFPAS